jgi:hypothetical protein
VRSPKKSRVGAKPTLRGLVSSSARYTTSLPNPLGEFIDCHVQSTLTSRSAEKFELDQFIATDQVVGRHANQTEGTRMVELPARVVRPASARARPVVRLSESSRSRLALAVWQGPEGPVDHLLSFRRLKSARIWAAVSASTTSSSFTLAWAPIWASTSRAESN